MPIEFEEGTTEGQCPYCGDWIPSGQQSSFDFDPSQNVRIL